MPINLTNTGCLANVNVSEFINGVSTNSTYSGIASLNCIPFIIQNIIFWLLVFAGTVALILVIIAGIKFITSGGDAKQAEGARKTLTFAILGLVLILFSFAILNFIAKTTGINCITKFGFSQCTYTPKGVNGKPNEVNCDPDLYEKKCSRGICFCKDKATTGGSDTNPTETPVPQAATCTCNEPGGGVNHNSFKCTDEANPRSCSEFEICTNQSTKPSVPCAPITCGCRLEGGAPPDNNDFTCTDGYSASCSDKEYCSGKSVARPAWPCVKYK